MERELCIRKGAGTEDPSGDYNDYSGSWQVTVENTEVTMKEMTVRSVLRSGRRTVRRIPSESTMPRA